MPKDTSHRWRPIEDLPASHEQLAVPELRALGTIWQEQRASLEEAEALRTFNERLRRQWAIETGIIEHIYTLDRGVTQFLIEHGIDASFIPKDATDKAPQLVAAMIKDHEAAVEGLFSFITGERRLSVGYVKELHAVLTRHQPTATGVDSLGREVSRPLRRGDYKQLPNNPLRANGTVHEYCPPEHVAAEMERLVRLHHEHRERGVPPEVEAAWLHHRFTQIHPFEDGNGRVARCLATLVMIQHGWFPLVITRDDRNPRYIPALEAADAGELSSLIKLFADIEKRALIGALSVARDVLRSEHVHTIIEEARAELQRRQRAVLQQWQEAKTLAKSLHDHACTRLKRVSEDLSREIGAMSSDYEFFQAYAHDDDERSHYFRNQIIDTANALDYFANTSIYRSWVRLVMKTSTQAEILVSFHGIGHDYRGILVASACFFRREETEEGQREVSETVPLSDDLFQINYLESLEEVRGRFDSWLDAVLVRGLAAWRRSL